MEFFIAVVVILLIFFGVVYTVTKGSPQPTRADIEYALKKYLGYSPIEWDFKFGKETKASNGNPAWPVIYHITTSSVGKGRREIILKLLFYREGYDWKTEKIM
jgi:hypothetical protein